MRNHGVEFNPDLVQQWGQVHEYSGLPHTLVSFQGVSSSTQHPMSE